MNQVNSIDGASKVLKMTKLNIKCKIIHKLDVASKTWSGLFDDVWLYSPFESPLLDI